MGRRFTGWRLERNERERLLRRFPPAYPDVVADHVTLPAGEEPDRAPLLGESAGEIVGRVDDGAGLEALVVRIAGETRRPDGSIYHVTWSLDLARGREAVQSNDVLTQRGWIAVDPPIRVWLLPQS